VDSISYFCNATLHMTRTIVSTLNLYITATTSNASSNLWHSRLGHASLPRVQLLASQGHLGSIDLKSFDCVSCHLGKQTHLFFNKSESLSSAPFDLVHYDIWGPTLVPSEGVSLFCYFFMIILVILGYIYYSITLNSLKFIKIFIKWYKPNFLIPSNFLRSNNAMEYNEKSFQKFLKQNRTLSYCSCHYTSQQNGRAKCKHCHILDTIRALLISASLLEHFWGEVALTAIYTINHVPSPTIHNQTLYEHLCGSTPNYSLLHIFRCICFVTLPWLGDHSKRFFIVTQIIN
jgi:hypothetical protein